MKNIVSLIVLILACLPCLAQPGIGVIAGAVLAKTNQEFSKNNQLGAYVGVVADFKVAKSLSFKPQLKYIKKGELTISGEKGNYNYLELPLNVTYNVPTPIGRFIFGCGPVLGYMLSGSWTTRDGKNEKINFSYDRVNQFDMGVNVVAGFDIKENVFFNMNYTLGLTDVWAAENLGTNKNRAIGIGIGVMF